MGDVVIASALFEDIARAFPGREIHLNTLPSWKMLFKDDTRFQHIFAIDLRNKQHPLRGILEWVNDPKRGRHAQPRFRLRGVEFGVAEIESIVQEDTD